MLSAGQETVLGMTAEIVQKVQTIMAMHPEVVQMLAEKDPDQVQSVVYPQYYPY
jgi:hypothetical protein